ncbi:MAG: hypothetical protein KF757_07055 [Phycisphaeraceae bacterium]|nr:hypothetical protein [Phycisphaeraceae bacterium]MCW5763351.1 hypothetical protein [Phycisphaeraceae bacterium]
MASLLTAPVVRLPLRSAIAWSAAPGLFAAVAIAIVFSLIHGQSGLVGVALAAAGVTVGAAAGWGVLAVGGASARSAGAWSLIIVYAQAARMMMALVIGGGLFFLLRPAPAAFWATLLAMLLAMLAVESACSIRWIRAASPKPESGVRNVHA